MTTNTLLVTLLPTLVTFLVTSGVWIGVFFVVGLGQPSAVSNYYYGSDASQPPAIPTYPPMEQCPAEGTYSKCSVDCEFQICESLPPDLYDTERGTQSTTECWLRLIRLAEKEIVMGTYYWTLLKEETDKDCKDKEKCDKWSDDGKQVYDALAAAAKKGIAIRIAVNTPDPNGNGFAREHTLNEPLALRDINPEIVRVRSVNFTRLIGAGNGLLHTKSFTVDGKHAYVGSANFDWRSLTQTKEIGFATFNCSCIAEDIQRMIDMYWDMGAEDAVLPGTWPATYSANANHDHPYNVPRTEGPATAIYFSSAPPQFNACGRDNDIDNMIQLIDEAEDFLYMAVMDYAPTSLFEGQTTPNIYYERLDAAIKRAAFERFVNVKFMMSKWKNENPKLYSYIHEFDDFNYKLPCKPGVTPCKTGSIEARLFHMPEEGWEGVPFVRYQHTKYFISEHAAYIGTSNWAADYWINTAGIGITIRSADHGGQEKLVEQVKSVYMQDWNSPYSIPISKFTIDGTLIDD